MTELIFVLLSVFFFSHINAIYSRHPYEFEDVKVEYRAKNFMALVAFGYYTNGWGASKSSEASRPTTSKARLRSFRMTAKASST